MKKNIHYDKNALKELSLFSRGVQKDFLELIEIIEKEGRLDPPEGKKITKNLFEMRVESGGIFRGFYAYVYKNFVVILHFFQKKTQKTPLKNIEVAKRRLKKYV